MLVSILGSDVLVKSTMDSFDYLIRLRTGELIRYSEAKIVSQGWLHLEGARLDTGRQDDGEKFPRGIDVRVDDIVWAKDAPYGS